MVEYRHLDAISVRGSFFHVRSQEASEYVDVEWSLSHDEGHENGLKKFQDGGMDVDRERAVKNAGV